MTFADTIKWSVSQSEVGMLMYRLRKMNLKQMIIFND
ncbi:hypothetical protein LVISKB_1955 [Levilactobacillus brevis KB290]|uniref:Uncharacterized protein n=1 Tax=Levilactobacillus brevis KB290 TaxID=1001583 RepID=M5AGQ4_LEVBR|nr:hypothetical protein LVISKB_1955 [Levilactobacillus brevis KB290]